MKRSPTGRTALAALSLTGLFAGVPAQGQAAARLDEVRLRTERERVVVTLRLSEAVHYRRAVLPTPQRFYIDLLGTRISPRLERRRLEVGRRPLDAVRIGQFRKDVTRVVFDLGDPTPVTVSQQAGNLIVALPTAGPALLPAPEGPSPLPPATLPPTFVWRQAAPPPPGLPADRPPDAPEREGAASLSAGPGAPMATPSPPQSRDPLLSRRRNGLDYLVAGQRIKVQGNRFEEGVLVADEIEILEGGGSLEIEGLVDADPAGDGSFSIRSLRVVTNSATRFEDGSRRPISSSAVRRGLRAKVKFAALARPGEIIADVVRVYDRSGDRDFELEAPVEALAPDELELTTLVMRVRINSRTRFPNLSSGTAETAAGFQRGIRRDDDEPRITPIRVGPVLIGGRVGMSYRGRRRGGEATSPADFLFTRAQVEASLPFGEFHEAYARISFNRTDNLSGPGPAVNRVRLRDAFVYFGHVLRPELGLQIGRQRFRDRREWFYDDRLDSVRLHWQGSRLKAEAAVARALFRPTGSRSDQFYLIGSARYQLPGRRFITAYVIKRNDLTPRDEDPVWLGVNSRGRLTRNLDYWLEAALMKGRRRQRQLSGYGFDLGGSYRFNAPLQPTLTLGYALGSGDSNPSDGVDRTFRQTGLEDNSYRHNGLKRYRYYGVLTEPELSNLQVATIDVGIRPLQMWSLNVAYHRYRQLHASTELGDFELDIVPSGLAKGLGQEIDVIVAIREFKRIDFNVLSGLFLPGPAFGPFVSSAFYLRADVQFFF